MLYVRFRYTTTHCVWSRVIKENLQNLCVHQTAGRQHAILGGKKQEPPPTSTINFIFFWYDFVSECPRHPKVGHFAVACGKHVKVRVYSSLVLTLALNKLQSFLFPGTWFFMIHNMNEAVEHLNRLNHFTHIETPNPR